MPIVSVLLEGAGNCYCSLGDDNSHLSSALQGSQFLPKPGIAAFLPASWTPGKVGHLLRSLVTPGSGFFGCELLICALPQLVVLSVLCVCVQVCVEPRHRPQLSSSGDIHLLCESGSLADPGAHRFSYAHQPVSLNPPLPRCCLLSFKLGFLMSKSGIMLRCQGLFQLICLSSSSL